MRSKDFPYISNVINAIKIPEKRISTNEPDPFIDYNIVSSDKNYNAYNDIFHKKISEAFCNSDIERDIVGMVSSFTNINEFKLRIQARISREKSNAKLNEKTQTLLEMKAKSFTELTNQDISFEDSYLNKLKNQIREISFNETNFRNELLNIKNLPTNLPQITTNKGAPIGKKRKVLF